MAIRNIRRAGIVFGLLAGCLSAQSVLSVKSGLVHYVEGQVYLSGKQVESKFGQFPSVKDKEELRTEEGRAEVLLTPGTFLRVAEDSSIRMLSTALSDTRFEMVKGEALLEMVDPGKDPAAKIAGNRVTALVGSAVVTFPKSGIFEFSTNPSRIRVFEGEAIVSGGGNELTLKKGKEALLSEALSAEKFDAKDTDELYRWSFRRSGYLAMANVSAANSMRTGSYSGSYYGSSYLGGGSGWAWNPFFGMFTFVPTAGYGYSPFGYNYFSPYTVTQAFYPYYYGGGGGGGRFASPSSLSGSAYSARQLGYSTASRSSGTFSPAASSGISASHSAPPMSAERGGDAGAARGASSGGGRGH